MAPAHSLERQYHKRREQGIGLFITTGSDIGIHQCIAYLDVIGTIGTKGL